MGKATKKTTETKSIINSKYTGKYREASDWMGDFIRKNASAFEEVTVNGKTVEQEAGLDVDALFTLAENNGLDVASHKKRKKDPGFVGNFRMSLGNMLRAVARKRHGLYDVENTFRKAPADWLSEQGAPEKATHTKDGEKIAVKKAA